METLHYFMDSRCKIIQNSTRKMTGAVTVDLEITETDNAEIGRNRWGMEMLLMIDIVKRKNTFRSFAVLLKFEVSTFSISCIL